MLPRKKLIIGLIVFFLIFKFQDAFDELYPQTYFILVS